MTTIAERKHMSRVAELGCAVCHRLGYGATPAELHHPRHGTGIGQRAKHMDVIPLCPEHHRGNTGVHGLGTKGFAKHYGFNEADLLADTLERLK